MAHILDDSKLYQNLLLKNPLYIGTKLDDSSASATSSAVDVKPTKKQDVFVKYECPHKGHIFFFFNVTFIFDLDFDRWS